MGKFGDPPNRNCRIPKTHKYTRKCIALLCQIGERYGLSNTAVVELAVRKWAKEEGFDIDRPPGTGDLDGADG